MSEQPTAGNRPPGAPGGPGGKKILGMSRPQAIGLGIVVLGGIAYLIYRARKNAAAAAAQSSQAGTCPDGSTPDASGNCPQSSQDFSGQLATLQSEIGQLQSELAGVGGGGSQQGPGGVISPPQPQPGPIPGPGPQPGPRYPLQQTGRVTSATTHQSGNVSTSDGGMTWNYTGVPPGKGEPQNQTGTVYSYTTQRTGDVKTTNAGRTWTYAGVPSSN